MKLKKILAVALAATTALSSGAAYDMLGASKAYAAAGDIAGTEKDDTFTVDDKAHNVTYTYTVTKAAKYTNANNTAVTTNATVKLTGIEVMDSDVNDGNFSVKVMPTVTTTEGVTPINYAITGVELDGSSVSDLGNVQYIDVTEANKNIEKVVVKNFDDSSNKIMLATTKSSSTVTPVKLEEVDFTNSYVTSGISSVKEFIGGSATSLKKFRIKGLMSIAENTSDDESIDFANPGLPYAKLEVVDLSDNDVLKTVTVVRGGVPTTTGSFGGPYPMVLNLNGSTNIENLSVYGQYTREAATNKGALIDGNKGVTFITDDSDEGSREVDLSAYSIKELTINGAGIESLVVPSEAEHVYVQGNLLTKLDVSAASSMKTLNASSNMLMDIDVAACGDMTTLDLSNNFLTALDVSSCDSLKSGTVAKNNYIPKANFTKASSGQSGLSTGDQSKPTIVAMALTGDGGLKSNKGENANGIMKIGGTGNVVAAFVVAGAPEGFAEKYAETITWTEANENGGAISLGQASVLGTQYKYDGNGNTYNYGQARVFVTAPITAADVKTAQEKITITAGNVKHSLSVQADNAVIVSYDTATNLPANKIADEGDNAYLKDFGMVFAPQQAAILPSSGTVSVKLDDVTPKDSVDTFNLLKGVQVDSWNTAADGSGTGYKFSGVGKGKSVKISEDLALTAIYKEKTFTVNFDKGSGFDKSSGSAPTSMKNLNWGDEVALSANGWSSTVKVPGSSNDYNDNTFMAWIEKDDSNFKAYSDGANVFGGKLGVASKYSDKKGTANLKALWSNGNYSMTLENNSVSLTLTDQTKNIYGLDDLDAKIESYVDGQDPADKNLVAYSNDTGVVDYANGFLFAKGAGNATVYVYDKANKVAATVAVSVMSADEAAQKKLDLENQKKIDAGETVDVSSYSKIAASVKKNADGDNTVTIVKGKNLKNVKINTIVIGDKTYTVTRIAANAYKGMSKIVTVTMSNSVKVIGKAAFANCKKLKKVTMGKGLVKIGANAFKNDKKLVKVLIKSKKLTKKARVGKNSFKSTGANAKFYIAKKAATFKKVKKAIKAQSGVSKKAKYVKKYA